MKTKRYITQVIAVVLSMMATIVIGCTDEYIISNHQVLRPTEVLSFRTSLDNGISVGTSRSTSGYLLIEEEEWTLQGTDSRATMMTSLNGDAQVLGFMEKESVLSYKDTAVYSTLTFRGDELTNTTNPVFWKDIENEDGDNLHIFAYAPQNIDEKVNFDENRPTCFSYTVPGIENNQADNQIDIVVDTAKVAKNYRKEIPLTFKHIFTAVRFKLGFACTVKSIKLEGIKNTGTYSIGGGWSSTSGAASYEFSYGDGLSLGKDDIVGDTLMLLPQTLATGAKVTMSYVKDGEPKTFVASLTGKTWEEGKFITYTLRDKKQEYVYLDLAAGDVTIEGNKYSGSFYKNETDTQKVTKKLFSPDTLIFYVYQSTEAKRKQGEGIIVNKEWKELKYDPVKVGNKLWSDFITNNKNVEQVIEAWDNEAGAGKTNSSEPNQEGAVGAVREVGREATKNRIHIKGNVGNVSLFIDNIYSSYQLYSPGTDGVTRTRDKGGISFLPSQDAGHSSTLTINILGDNRLGCVNYQNSNDTTANNRLVFEGTGSLTVGDTDYFRYGELGLNRSCSVIGGQDEPRANQDVYNIVFNSGIIYAGATTSSCTAIGGGGNGNTSIVINGGTITAVAKTTGTAIGGGTGLVQPGGKGEVTIYNGTVYAYNERNSSNVPSSAIGGAGSRDVDGSEGKVNIHGGYVYAYSAYGTALGGGSSLKTVGGNAIINITGGQIIAKSGDGAGIGGGSACTGKSGTNKKGGDAVVTISGNPVIRTGSIGGGSTGAKESNIGSATINISGNPDIQAQFVMAAGSGKPPKFTMSGGVIRNTDVTKTFETAPATVEYRYTKGNGGAVYLENGTFTMTGGTIENCKANQGGAVFISGSNNTTFTMSGGTIMNCSSEGNGGAVYLQGGTVSLSSNDASKTTYISRNLANNGNGGGIYIDKGSFSMDGNVAIEGNSATNKNNSQTLGKGGGVYVTSSSDNVKVNILSGFIRGNSSDRLGGGVCVEMSGKTQASILVGSENGTQRDNPTISGNHTLSQGGGLYAKGVNAHVTIYHGTINGNTTTAYVHNENVSNEGGMVTLVGDKTKVDVTHNVVYFHANADDATFDKDKLVQIAEQRIVTSTNSHLVQPSYISRDNYEFDCWHTRMDGDDSKGSSYQNNDIMNINKDLHLYARWK